MNAEKNKENRFVVCIKNEGYPASLEVRKIYLALADAAAAERELMRVIDNSKEDYLYPLDYFADIELPKAAEIAFYTAT